MSTKFLTRYKLDLSGTLPDNLINNELRYINNVKEQIFLTDFGPFYKETLIITQNGLPIPTTDYSVYGYVKEPTERSGKEVATIIQLTNPTILGELRLSYQMVGGEYINKTGALIEHLKTLNLDEKTVDFNHILGKPLQYRPIDHKEDGRYLIGMEYVIETIDGLKQLIQHNDLDRIKALIDGLDDKFNYIQSKTSNLSLTLAQKLDNISNVQLNITKEDLGLELVDDLPLAATGDIAQYPTTNEVYITPFNISQMLNNITNRKGSVAHGNSNDVLNQLAKSNDLNSNETWFYATPMGTGTNVLWIDGIFKATLMGIHESGGVGFYMDSETGVPMHKIVGLNEANEEVGVLRRQHRFNLDNKVIYTPFKEYPVDASGNTYITLDDLMGYRGDRAVRLVDSWFYTHTGDVVLDGNYVRVNLNEQINILQGVGKGTINVGNLESLNNTVTAITMVGTYLNHSTLVDRAGYSPNIIVEATKNGDYSEFNTSLTNEPIKVNVNLNFKYENGNQLTTVGVGKHLAVGDTEILSKPNLTPNLEDKAITYGKIANTKPGFKPMDVWTHGATLNYLINKNQNKLINDGNVNLGYGVSNLVELDNLGSLVTGGNGLTLTGSGPNGWYHSKNTIDGISDLMGNVWERLAGVYVNEDKLYIAPDSGVYSESAYIDKGNIKDYGNVYRYTLEPELITPPRFDNVRHTHAFGDYWFYTTNYETAHLVDKLTGTKADLFKPVEYGRILDSFVGRQAVYVVYTQGIIAYTAKDIYNIFNHRLVRTGEYDVYGLIGDNIFHAKDDVITRYPTLIMGHNTTGEIIQPSKYSRTQLHLEAGVYSLLSQTKEGELIKLPLDLSGVNLSELVVLHNTDINTNLPVLSIKDNSNQYTFSVMSDNVTLITDITPLTPVGYRTTSKVDVFNTGNLFTKVTLSTDSFSNDTEYTIIKTDLVDPTKNNGIAYVSKQMNFEGILTLGDGVLLLKQDNIPYISYDNGHNFIKLNNPAFLRAFTEYKYSDGKNIHLQDGSYLSFERSGLFGVDTNITKDLVDNLTLGTLDPLNIRDVDLSLIDSNLGTIVSVADNIVITHNVDTIYLVDVQRETFKVLATGTTTPTNIVVNVYDSKVAYIDTGVLYYSDNLGLSYTTHTLPAGIIKLALTTDYIFYASANKIYCLDGTVVKSLDLNGVGNDNWDDVIYHMNILPLTNLHIFIKFEGEFITSVDMMIYSLKGTPYSTADGNVIKTYLAYSNNVSKLQPNTLKILYDAKITLPANGGKGYLKVGGSYLTPEANAFTLDFTDDGLAKPDVGYRIKYVS